MQKNMQHTPLETLLINQSAEYASQQ